MRNKKMKVMAGALAAATVLTAGTLTVAAEGGGIHQGRSPGYRGGRREAG